MKLTGMVFPDISKLESGERTCAHLIKNANLIKQGDVFLGIPRDGDLGYIYRVLLIKTVRFKDDVDEFMAKKNGYSSVEEYFRSWNELHPDALAESNPEVIRIDFKKVYSTFKIKYIPSCSYLDDMVEKAMQEICEIEDKKAIEDIYTTEDDRWINELPSED